MNIASMARYFQCSGNWRVPVSESDGVFDNLLSDVDAASLIDANFDTALDYLAYYMDEAVTDWDCLDRVRRQAALM